jgi:hypothetical protein
MGQALGRAINVTEYVFPVLAPTYDDTHEYLVKFPSEAEIEVPAMLLSPVVQDKSLLGSIATVCVIYFHPNAADIGDCISEMEMIRDGAFDGDAVILAPEYPGYGLLIEYSPSVEGIDRVAAAAWQFCLEGLGFSANRIVLWGRSIGTGPSSGLAQSVASGSDEKSSALASALVPENGSAPQPPLGAVVLVAPFISIAEVAKAHTGSWASSLMSPMWEVRDLVSDPGLEDVPICILHPAEDEVIPPSHGSSVLENSSSRSRLGIWLRGATHNFILQEEHLERVGEFLGKHFGLNAPEESSSEINYEMVGLASNMKLLAYGDDPDEDDRQDIVNRLVWWSVSGRAELLVASADPETSFI